MIRTKVVIASSREDVWRWLTESANWKLWWGADLLEMAPGWEKGAAMRWAGGSRTTLVSFEVGSALGLEGPFLLTTIGLTSLAPGSTEVEIIEEPLGGASFADAGAGRINQLNGVLAGLKKGMETRTTFLGPLTPEERLAVGNLPMDVYESVIREKTPGVPNLVMGAPDPDAFWKLQEQKATLQKLAVEDIKRLKESVSLVMQADIVARRGDVLAGVRGAEMYSNAARYNPFNDLALMSCGVALARAGYHREALPWLTRALEVNPGNERVKTNLDAAQADVAKARDPGSPLGRLLGDLPETVRPESIPRFDLRWPPPERPSYPATPEARTAALPAAGPTEYASIWLRLAAMLIDGTLLTIASMILVAVLYPIKSASKDPAELRGLALMLLVPGWIYFAAMESSAKGATLGKMALGLRVTDMKGGRISFARATGRTFAKALSVLTFYIGFLMAVFTAKKQTLHDLVAGCLVIRRK